MAGRGRGRGRGGGLSINIEAFGLGRGDIITPIQAQPPPLFPPLQFKPVPLLNNDELEYRLALKQELRDMFRKSPYYLNPPKKVKDIERYSDRYQAGVGDHTVPKLTPYWDRLPHELREKRKRKVPSKVFKPSLKNAQQVTENVENLFDKLEKDAPTNEDNDDVDANEEDEDEKKKKDKQEEDDEEEIEEYDDEDLEEETDYNMAYFDNGEGYGDDDDEDDEGPTY